MTALEPALVTSMSVAARPLPPPSVADKPVLAHVGDVLAEPLAAVRPRLRGWLHAGVSPVVLAAGIVLVCLAPTSAARWPAVVYSLAGVILFFTSAIFNVGNWQGRGHAILQRLDHSSIYLIIAGTYTPVAALALDGWKQDFFIAGAWVGAGLGVLFRVFWIRAPRLLCTSLYLGLGWAIAPFIGDLFEASVVAAVLTLAGGILYTVGGVVYGTRRPDPNPTWFGFHEVFHAFTIGAWACQYVAISFLTYRA
jgi:hemolysin III